MSQLGLGQPRVLTHNGWQLMLAVFKGALPNFAMWLLILQSLILHTASSAGEPTLPHKVAGFQEVQFQRKSYERSRKIIHKGTFRMGEIVASVFGESHNKQKLV